MSRRLKAFYISVYLIAHNADLNNDEKIRRINNELEEYASFIRKKYTLRGG